MSILSGRKTYLVAAALVVYQLLGYFLKGTPVDLNVVLEALGLATLRAGVTKSGPTS